MKSNQVIYIISCSYLRIKSFRCIVLGLAELLFSSCFYFKDIKISYYTMINLQTELINTCASFCMNMVTDLVSR